MMRSSAWLVMAVVCLSGCARSGTPVLSSDDNGRTVEMTVGQTLTLTLPANRTTGYAWVPTGSITGVLTLEGTPLYRSDAPGRVGSGGSTTWVYRAISPGIARLRMDYRRAFEDDIPAAKLFEVTVNVSQ